MMLPTKPMSKDKMSGEGWGQHLLRLGREEDSRGAPAKGGHQTKRTTTKTTAIVRRNERGLLFATIKASFETSHSRRDEQACLSPTTSASLLVQDLFGAGH